MKLQKTTIQLLAFGYAYYMLSGGYSPTLAADSHSTPLLENESFARKLTGFEVTNREQIKLDKIQTRLGTEPSQFHLSVATKAIRQDSNFCSKHTLHYSGNVIEGEESKTTVSYSQKMLLWDQDSCDLQQGWFIVDNKPYNYDYHHQVLAQIFLKTPDHETLRCTGFQNSQTKQYSYGDLQEKDLNSFTITDEEAPRSHLVFFLNPNTATHLYVDEHQNITCKYVVTHE